MTISRPARNPFVWPGSKARLMPLLVRLLPHHTHYVSVFGGTGADILGKPRSRVETFNDLDENVTGLFRVLADAAARRALCRWIEATAYSRRGYEAAFRVLREDGHDPVTRAWAFLTAANQKQAGAAPDPPRTLASSWGSVRRRLSPAWLWPQLPARLEAVAARFRGVQIENRPWEDVLARFDAPHALFFLDPPSLPATRPCEVSRNGMFDDEHRRLLGAVTRLRGKVVLTGRVSPPYDAAPAGWRAIRYGQRRLLAPADSEPLRENVVWVSPDHGRREVSL